jgi:hypothetical protein
VSRNLSSMTVLDDPASVEMDVGIGFGSKRSLNARKRIQSVLLLSYVLGVCGSCIAASPAPSVGPAIVVNTLWEIPLGADYATTVGPSERDAHPPFLGLFYIPSSSADAAGNALPGVQLLYRLLSSTGSDHMDSLTAGEGGYQTEGPLGYAWSKGTSEFGLSPIIRMYDTQPQSANVGDHATAVEVAPVPHPQALPSYFPEGPIGYGYARYPGTDNVLAWQAGGAVTVKSNLAVGCALWEWWWNGLQFVNDYDYGRQMQVALYPLDGPSTLGEAGDAWGGPSIAVDARHPSPCVTFATGTSPTGPYQTTAAVPLDWSPQSLGGGSDNPVIYPSVRLGKTITLDWIGPDNIDRNWPVALFQTNIQTPSNSPGVSDAFVETPTGYLTAQFNTYYYYNPATQALTQVPVSTVCGTNCGAGYNVPLPASGPQAVILASGTSPTSPAMGVYINNPNSGMTFYDNSSGTSTGEYGSNFVKWGALYRGPVSAGAWTYNTWVMTDTRQNVIAYMNQLYAWGVVSR